MSKQTVLLIICFLAVLFSVKEIKSAQSDNDTSIVENILPDGDNDISLGYTLFKQKKYEEAKTKFLAVVDRNPKNDKAYIYLGIIFSRRGEKEKAIEAFKKALEINPDNSEAHFNIGIEYYNDKQFYKSLNHLKKDLSFLPNDYRAISVMGSIYFELNDTDRALEYLLKSESISPGSAGNLIKIADCYRVLGRLDDEIEVYRKILKIQSSFYVYYRLGLALGDKGDIAGEIDCYKKALSMRPDHKDVRFNLGVSYYDIGEYELALSEFLKIKDDDNIDVELIYYLGLTDLRLNKISDAWQVYETIKKIDPETADNLYDMIKRYSD